MRSVAGVFVAAGDAGSSSRSGPTMYCLVLPLPPRLLPPALALPVVPRDAEGVPPPSPLAWGVVPPPGVVARPSVPPVPLLPRSLAMAAAVAASLLTEVLRFLLTTCPLSAACTWSRQLCTKRRERAVMTNGVSG